MNEQVTFGVEVANALLGAGVPVVSREEQVCRVAVVGFRSPYHLPEGTTLTSGQVTAAVQADPGKLAARYGGRTYSIFDGAWRVWSPPVLPNWVKTGWSPETIFAPSQDSGPWRLVYRPDLKAEPEEPPHPVQGTTLRAIMEWCAKSQKGAFCRRMSWCSDICDCHIDGDGDLETDEIWLSAEDVYEATDWQCSVNDGETWFVPGQVECSECGGFGGRSDPCSDQFYQCDRRDGSGSIGPTEESGPKETVSLDFMRDVELPRTTRALSEAVAHVESGGVMDGGGELFRIRDGAWEYRSAGESSWSRDDGKWFVSTGEKYTLHPADYLDDAPKVEPREGPELWAWIIRRTGRIVGSADGAQWRLLGNQLQVRHDRCEWIPCDLFPDVPCTPEESGWGDES